jgi:hypothetical protein
MTLQFSNLQNITNELRDILPHPQFSDKTWQEKVVKDTALLDAKNAKLISCPSDFIIPHEHYLKAMKIYEKTSKDIETMFSVLAVFDKSKNNELIQASNQVGKDWDDADAVLGLYATAMDDINNRTRNQLKKLGVQ